VSEPPDELDGLPHEREDGEESGSESAKAGDGRPGEAGFDEEGESEGEVPRPFAFRLVPEVDISGVLDAAKFSKLIFPRVSDISKFLPDFGRLVPPSAKLPLAQFEELVIPALHLPKLVPKIDYASYASLFPKIELPDFSLISQSWPKLPPFSPTFLRLLERLRESLPPNWPPDIDLDKLTTVIQDEGLPLVWVPRAEIVTEMLAAPDRIARVEVLLARSNEFVGDCRAVLSDTSHDTLSGQRPLAVKALVP
jgi:hypothetical protein